VEEERGERGDARLVVAQAQRQRGHVALDLHHVVEDEVREHHQARLAHACAPPRPVTAAGRAP